MTQQQAFNLFMPMIEDFGKEYYKYSLVRAFIANNEEYIETWTSDGLETTNYSKPGDFIVQNLQTESMEKYIVSEEMFLNRYQFFYQDLFGAIYLPKGRIKACMYSGETMSFIANWGRQMILKSGDYIASPYPHYNEVYRIASKEFFETYDQLKNFDT